VRVGDNSGSPEIEHLDLAGGGHPDVGRFEVAMHHTRRMGGLKASGDPARGLE